MPDRRSEILDRIEEVLAAVTPSRTVYRNRSDLSSTERPCRVLLDGTETVDHNFEKRAGRVYARTAPSVMVMQPEIFELLRVREPKKSGEYAPQRWDDARRDAAVLPLLLRPRSYDRPGVGN